MSEEIKKDAEPIQGQEEKQNIDKKKDQEDNIDTIVDKKLDAIKDFYEKKLSDAKANSQGLDKKVTELTKRIKDYEKKELTEEEQKKLREQEILDRELLFYKRESMVDFPNIDPDDKKDALNYISGNNEEEIQLTVNFWRELFDKAIKSGIEKGVNDRLASGYVPKGSLNNDKNEFDFKTKDEWTEKFKEINKMPFGPERDEISEKANKAYREYLSKI